jgi:hypothetical protein
MAFSRTWLVSVVYSRMVTRHILDPEYFKEEALPYSSVWIDSNSSWKEIGCERPTHMCGRQGVSVVV